MAVRTEKGKRECESKKMRIVSGMLRKADSNVRFEAVNDSLAPQEAYVYTLHITPHYIQRKVWGE